MLYCFLLSQTRVGDESSFFLVLLKDLHPLLIPNGISEVLDPITKVDVVAVLGNGHDNRVVAMSKNIVIVVLFALHFLTILKQPFLLAMKNLVLF
jgi:hypothetical protein